MTSSILADMNIDTRLIYMRRVAAMPRYYVGQCQIDDGYDAVDSFARAQVEDHIV